MTEVIEEDETIEEAEEETADQIEEVEEDLEEIEVSKEKNYTIQFVQLAEKKHKYLSNQQKESQFIVENALLEKEKMIYQMMIC